jgi:hypothetical protein
VGQRLECFRRPLRGQRQTHFLAASAWCFLQISAVHSTMLLVPPFEPKHAKISCTLHNATGPPFDPKYACSPQREYHSQSCSESSTNDSARNEHIPRCQRMASLIRRTSTYCSRANVQLPAHSRQPSQQSGPSIRSATTIRHVASNSMAVPQGPYSHQAQQQTTSKIYTHFPTVSEPNLTDILAN